MDGRVQNTRCFGSCPDQATTGATFSWHVVDVVIDADNEHGDGDDGDNDDVMVMVDRGDDNGHEDEDEDDDGMFRLGIETTTILEGEPPFKVKNTSGLHTRKRPLLCPLPGKKSEARKAQVADATCIYIYIYYIKV